MLYGALGDAIGYKNGDWEFEKDGLAILDQVKQLGGIQNVWVNPQDWPVSDDTVMHLATCIALWQAFHPNPRIAERLEELSKDEETKFDILLTQCAKLVNWNQLKCPTVIAFTSEKREAFVNAIMTWYVRCMTIMEKRAPGRQTIEAVSLNLSKQKMPDTIVDRAGGNGAAMRCMCIGLLSAPQDLVISLAGIASMATHPNYTAILGGIMSAAFTRMAINLTHPIHWPFEFFRHYYKPSVAWIQKQFPGSQVDTFFFDTWQKYLALRFALATSNHGKDKHVVSFDGDWLQNLQKRQDFFAQFAFVSADGQSWNGSSGHDSVMIAYDAILYDYNDWHTVLFLSAIHGGDSDSTASIAGAFFGALVGMRTPTMEGLEFENDIVLLAKSLPQLILNP